MPRILPLLSLLLLLVGCAAPSHSSGAAGSSSPGLALRVTWRDYRTGNKCELVSETHTDALALYSKSRRSADVKVQTDEALEALIEHLDELGFAKHAIGGKAPQAGAAYLHVLEIERPQGTSFVASGPSVPAEARNVANRCVKDFLQLYNITEGLQATENPQGSAYFDAQKQKVTQRP